MTNSPSNDETPDEQGAVSPRNKLNDLTAKEWLPETVSVWRQKGLGANHPDAQIEKLHPAPFSFTDVARLIRFFTKSGQTVLDPFVGSGTALAAAKAAGIAGIGIERSEEFCHMTAARVGSLAHSIAGDGSLFWADA